jgi:hypothetical protein
VRFRIELPPELDAAICIGWRRLLYVLVTVLALLLFRPPTNTEANCPVGEYVALLRMLKYTSPVEVTCPAAFSLVENS